MESTLLANVLKMNTNSHNQPVFDEWEEDPYECDYSMEDSEYAEYAEKEPQIPKWEVKHRGEVYPTSYQQILETIQQQLKELNQTLNQDQGRALIYNFVYSDERDHEKKYTEYGQRLAIPNDQRQYVQDFGDGKCKKCGDNKFMLRRNFCRHSQCLQCWKNTIESQSDPSIPFYRYCWNEGCETPINPQIHKEIGEYDEEFRKSFQENMCLDFIKKDPRFFRCQAGLKDLCGRIYEIKLSDSPLFYKCESCLNLLCCRCGQKYHGLGNCEEFLLRISKVEEKTDQILKQKGEFAPYHYPTESFVCPNKECKILVRVEESEDLKVICPSCGTQFCKCQPKTGKPCKGQCHFRQTEKTCWKYYKKIRISEHQRYDSKVDDLDQKEKNIKQRIRQYDPILVGCMENQKEIIQEFMNYLTAAFSVLRESATIAYLNQRKISKQTIYNMENAIKQTEYLLDEFEDAETFLLRIMDIQENLSQVLTK